MPKPKSELQFTAEYALSQLKCTPEEYAKARRKCQTDLFHLAKDVLGKDLEEQPHREMCNAFPQLNPDVPINKLPGPRQLLLETPRGSFKSTLNICAVVQFIVAYPDSRTLILCATRQLAQAFCDEARSYFVIEDEENLTLFQLLFIEHCVLAGKKEKKTQFTTPARKKKLKEPSVFASSPGSNLPGYHVDLLVADDVVTDINTLEPEQIEKVIKSFHYAKKLVDPNCFATIVGTPYSPNDLYAHLKATSPPGTLNVLERPAWTRKETAKGKLDSELTENDVDLFFPARLTFAFLMNECLSDQQTFRSQYLIDPNARTSALFPEEKVRARILPWQAIPTELSYFAVWDLAYGSATGSFRTDFSCGAVIGVDKNSRMYVVDMIYGRLVHSDLVFRIADFHRRYPLEITYIEDSPGARFLEPSIQQGAERLGVKAILHWIPVDRQKNAKLLRIHTLSDLMEANRLFFSGSCPFLDDIVNGFTSYTGSKREHDDIPDCLSLGAKFVPAVPKAPKSDIDRWAAIQERALQELIFPSVQEEVIAPLIEEPGYEAVNYFS